MIFGSALALACLVLPSLPGDTLCLKDGRIFDGVKLQRTSDGVRVQFQNGEVAVPGASVLDCVIESEAFVPVTDEEKQKAAEGLVPFQGKWLKPKERETRLRKLLDERRSEVEKLKQTRLWRNRVIEESKTFAVEYTVPPNLFGGFLERMEAYYAEFVKRWKIKRPRDLGKLKIRFYAEPDDFYQVTGVSRGVLAFFEHVEPPYRLQCYYDRLDPKGVERDVYHEFGHYLHKLVNPGFKYPHWPGESMAEYFSTAKWDPATKKLTVDPQVLEERLVEIHRDIEENEWVGLEQLITGANEGHYYDYTWGWSLIHFLMSKPDSAKKFEDFFLGLARGRDVEREGVSYLKNWTFEVIEGQEILESFKKALGIKKQAELRELEVAWHNYVKDELQVTSSRGLARAARMAGRYGRKQRAKRLYEEAIAAGDADALTHHRYAELLEDLNEKDGAREHWAKAVELDPLVADYYIAWGKSLLADKDKKDEAKRLLKLANEIEPDNSYLEQNLERLLAK